MTLIEILLIAGGTLLVFSAVTNQSIAQTLQSIISGSFLQSGSSGGGGNTPA